MNGLVGKIEWTLLSRRDSGNLHDVALALAADIFEAFRRGDPSRSRKSGGSGLGLGLAVVKAIAEAHGGQAYCQASGNGGSRFVLSWPLRP